MLIQEAAEKQGQEAEVSRLEELETQRIIKLMELHQREDEDAEFNLSNKHCLEKESEDQRETGKAQLLSTTKTTSFSNSFFSFFVPEVSSSTQSTLETEDKEKDTSKDSQANVQAVSDETKAEEKTHHKEETLTTLDPDPEDPDFEARAMATIKAAELILKTDHTLSVSSSFSENKLAGNDSRKGGENISTSSSYFSNLFGRN